ncbi:MAG: HAMP domain-containing histidine kinase [Actinomycetota bacterium]|nr:HAMP domain-containing histidine kinase [Actinomycetota bacterium]
MIGASSPGSAAGAPPTALRSVSVRARVLLAVVVVLGLTMLAAGFVVATIFDHQSQANAEELLTSRLQLARQLATQNITPKQLENRVDAQGVRATLTLIDGTQFGFDPVPGPRRIATLAGTGKLRGAKLTLTVDTVLLDGARGTLVRALLITGFAALLVGALLAMLATQLALAPLRRVATTALRIAGGQRGVRLNPSRRQTEIGQTAAAMDAMLDELEGAEGRALDSERRTKDFLADATHELRTPLAGISSAAEALLHQPLSADQREQLLVLLVREARRGSRLVDDLLAIARLDGGQPSVAVPTPITAIARDELGRIAAVHRGLTLQLTGPQRLVLADPAALQGILRNLLDNAVSAAGDSGAVTVTVHRGDPVLLDVADSGPGIPDADRERVFDRLVRLDAGRSRGGDGGSGLGLAIARAHARANGGELVCLPGGVDAGRNPLGGARFRLTLPTTQATSPSIR